MTASRRCRNGRHAAADRALSSRDNRADIRRRLMPSAPTRPEHLSRNQPSAGGARGKCACAISAKRAVPEADPVLPSARMPEVVHIGVLHLAPTHDCEWGVVLVILASIAITQRTKGRRCFHSRKCR